MRILQVCPRYPPQTGGVETHVREISERLVERGHEVTVHTADGREIGGKQESRNGVEVRRHLGLAPGGAFHLAPSIVSAVRRAEADVVHAHNYHSFPISLAAIAVGHERFVVTPHYHGRSASRLRNWLLRAYTPCGRRALRRADTVIAVSDWEREQLEVDFEIQTIVIPNGLDLERFEDVQPETRQRPYILSVGRLAAYKGVQEVIQALTELPKFDLVIVGEGPYRDALEQVSRETGVADRVEFLGNVDDDRLTELYSGAEVYITLSSYEAFGLTVAEALAAGTPCVVRAEGALREWAQYDGCVSVQGTNADEIALAINTTAPDTSVESTGVAWDTVVDRLCEEAYTRS